MPRCPVLRSPGRRAARAVFGMLLFAAFVFPAAGDAPDDALTVSAVQFEIDETTVLDREALAEEIGHAVETAAEEGADLVVFPEYLNVFPALSDDTALTDAVAEMDFSAEAIEAGDATGEQTVRELLARVYRHTGHRSLRSLFAARAEETSRWIDEAYGEAADSHDVHVIAGTYFALEEQGRRASLTNRAVAYDPDGRRSFEQDKVYLTAFERDLLGLDSADVGDASGIEIAGWSIALTICRDTYFEEWNEVHSDRDLWIDLRGEGTEYNAEVRRRLEGAVPERILETDVSYGLTVFLTGEFHGLYWEGRSSFVEESGDSVAPLSEAATTTGYDIISTTIKQ